MAIGNIAMLHRRCLFQVAFRLQLFPFKPCRFLSSNVSQATSKPPKEDFNVGRFKLDKIRNFCIIAHIDHGKSTLSDRFLEITGTVKKEDGLCEQFLDNLQVERERGITVKAQGCSLIWNYKGDDYLLNLIDTPGHVDFSFEVWRSLSACEGAILLVDANSGVQAQTVAHFNHALLSDMTILPVLNKIDLKNANIEAVSTQLKKLFEFDPNEIFKVSAKSGVGVKELLDGVVEKIPPPTSCEPQGNLRAVVFDLWHEKFKGIILLIRVLDGSIQVGSQVVCSTNPAKAYPVKELNVLHPKQVPVAGKPPTLYAGQVGVLITGITNHEDICIGDTIRAHDERGLELIKSEEQSKTKSLKAIPLVYASIYPCEKSEFLNLHKSLQKLLLNDSSVHLTKEAHPALGNGFKLGFLGLLHMEVFCQRLDDEFDAPVVITAPSVPYKVRIIGEKNIKQYGSEELVITNATSMPNKSIIKTYYEPMIKGTIITPDSCLHAVETLCMERRGKQLDSYYIDNSHLLLVYRLPLNEVIIDFVDKLKGATSGYASFDSEDDGYCEAELVKLDFLINDKPVEELSMIVHFTRARPLGRSVCDKLADHLERQQFKIKIQAAVGGKIIARSNVAAYRKDVTQKLKSGGDLGRRQKLLKQQAEGKARMRLLGNIEISPETFINVLKW